MSFSITTPYRACPLGAHVDHQHGEVTGFALDRGVTLDYEADDGGGITLTSRNFGGTVTSTVHKVMPREADWGDYVRSAVFALTDEGYALSVGFRGEIGGTLPIGGLSSSASVIITYICALCRLNGISLNPERLIELAHFAETRYIGLNNGVLDQSCEVYGRRESLLHLDTLDGSRDLIAQPVNMPPYELLIIFSGVEHALVNSAYNARVDECKAAAYALKALGGMHYGKFADARLRDIPEEVFRRYADRLPFNWARRAEHYYSETSRVGRGVEAWRRGDLDEFGSLMFQSGTSSIDNYEAGSPELKALHDIALHTRGIYGGRFSGAGFKGCYLALTAPDERESIEASFTKNYLAAFPDMAERFGIYSCRPADGVAL